TRSDGPIELALRLGHAARCESRALRFECELLAAGKRVELGPVQFELDAELVLPDLEHPRGPPHEVGLPGEGTRLAGVEVLALGEVGPALAGGEDDRPLELTQ